ncbi:hypothetical protein D9758_000057 [Tetrapyrgos nigripes]|uniref:AP complex mu/sigma subunit domain-containing protein n=1 Tax=Tetrapyrgos nigripes TaxID=182062 RepID=A0A8H5H1C2_9AGAR|nr:hypothetical protein D9758_000057 [Tetrapyrgos nigripes]
MNSSASLANKSVGGLFTGTTQHCTLSSWWMAQRVFVESLDRAFENVCELDLVFHFDEVGCIDLDVVVRRLNKILAQVHHILAEIIQGGLVLETNVDEIDDSVQTAAKLRRESYASANPLSLSGGLAPRGGNLQTPLGWLTGKLTGVGAR